MSLYVSNILLKKVIEEILIKNDFYMSDFLLKKVIEEFWSKMSFYVSNVFKEIYRRSFDQK